MGETVGVMPQAASPAPPSTPAAVEKPKGAVGIWIGVLLIVGGIVLGIALVVGGAKSLLSGFDDLQRVPISTGGVVRIEDTGTQTIYAERITSSGGTSFSTNTYGVYTPNIALRVTGPDGGEVTVDTGGSTETYTYDGRDGVSIGSFQASTPGEYRIETRAEDGGFQPYSTLAVGSALQWGGIGAILGGVFGGGLVVLVGIILVIVFAVRRSRSKKRIAQASSPYPGAGPGGGWPAAPGYAPSGYAPSGYAGGYAGGGYGAPATPGAPPAGGWAPGGTNPGWVPPPVAQPDAGQPEPTWSPPPPPAPADTPPTWQPPAPEAPTNWQPSGDAPAPEAPTNWQPSGDAPAPDPAASPGEPSAPSWDPPASGDAPPAPPAGGESPPSS